MPPAPVTIPIRLARIDVAMHLRRRPERAPDGGDEVVPPAFERPVDAGE